MHQRYHPAPLANPYLGFGGVQGTSGMGSYHGKVGFGTFSHTKSILKKSNRLISPSDPPYGKLKRALIKENPLGEKESQL